VKFNASALILGPLISMTGSKNVSQFMHKPNVDDLVYVKELIEAGKVVPVIAKRYPLSETAEAFREYGERHPSGKVVIIVEHDAVGEVD